MLKRTILIVVALSLTATTSEIQAQTPNDASVRLELLKTHMTTLRDDAVFGRKLGGGLTLGLSTPFIAGAFYLDHKCDAKTSAEDDDGCEAGVWGLAIVGGVFAATGLLILALPADEETLTDAWLQEEGADGVSARVLRGEGLLRSLSDNGRQARYIAAGSMFALGALNASAAYGGDDFGSSATITSLVFWGGLGALQLFSKTPAEKQWDGYQDAVRGEVSHAPLQNIYITPAAVASGSGVVGGINF